jgi:Protein of unknown function (DUF1670)
MLPTPYSVKHYASALERFFKPALRKFFLDAFPNYFGKVVVDKISDELIAIFERHRPERDYLEVGQVLWNALDKNTRGDSPWRRFVPVVLTLVSTGDVQRLVKGEKPNRIAQGVVARIIREAYDQGGILSSRDIALLTLRDSSWVSRLRMGYEKEHQVILPHTGVLHDMGSCITHKKQIIQKIVVEKKDPALVAKETNHTQKAVDHYLHDYYRVKTVFQSNLNVNYIHSVTNISKNVVKQYIELYNQFEALT